MNKVTHQYGRDTATLLMLPYMVTSISGMGYNIVEKAAIGIMSLILVHTASQFGAEIPDYDQNESALPVTNKKYVETNWRKIHWDFCLAVHRALHLWGATHRSWHTHSVFNYWLIAGIPAILVNMFLYKEKTDIIYFLFHLLLLTFTVSASIHCILDMFNFSGARWVPWQKKSTNLLPNTIRIPIIRIRPFKHWGVHKFKDGTWGKTGGDYEKWFQRRLNAINKFAFLVLCLTGILSLFDVSLFDLTRRLWAIASTYDYTPYIQKAEDLIRSQTSK